MGCLKLAYNENESLLKVVHRCFEVNEKSDAGGFRYGFNGKEWDDELNVEGGALDFGARIYDSRLGRWMSLDPLQFNYPDLSPYNFCSNSPIMFVEKDGRYFDYAITPNKDGKGEIIAISITVYKYGPDPNHFLSNEKNLNARLSELTKNPVSFTDENGDTWIVKINMEVVEKNTQEAAMNSASSKSGGNIMNVDPSLEEDPKNYASVIQRDGQPVIFSEPDNPTMVQDITATGGTGSNVSSNNPSTITHSIGHLMGLGERYKNAKTEEGFEGDIMSVNPVTHINPIHYKDLGKAVLEVYRSTGNLNGEYTGAVKETPSCEVNNDCIDEK